MNLYHGTIYAFMSNHDADLDAMIKSLKSSLALISGVAVQTAAAHKSG
jgi:hypothetical protein